MSRTTWIRDLLIIGQGIAGSVLALSALAAGHSVRVLDKGHSPSSSLAAAGMVNPFILKRRRLVWKANEHVQEAQDFYSDWENVLGQSFYHPSRIHRLIHDVSEWNDWKAMEGESNTGVFHGGMTDALPSGASIDAPHGYFLVEGSGWMDVPVFLNAVRDYLTQDDSYRKDEFEPTALKESAVGYRYHDADYINVVICTGVPSLGTDSRFEIPLFGELPFNPAKGHTVDVRVPDWGLEEVVHGAVFVIPIGEDVYRIGSTYSWHLLDEVIEPKEISRLLADFETICSLPYEVVASRAGVRPATKDRRPLIGSIPENPRFHMFGGLGSRAVMNAPSLAKILLQSIFHGAPIPKEISLAR